MKGWTEILWPELNAATRREVHAYLLGAAHDATFSRLHGTTRFCQADDRWIHVLGFLLTKAGHGWWSYREGADRGCFVAETGWKPPTMTFDTEGEKLAYVRGYFDAEGGIPKRAKDRFYIQFVQKDLVDLTHVRDLLSQLGIVCGGIHNPSVRVDPDYWRFYVLSSSREDFVRSVRSWHPRKRLALEERFPLRPEQRLGVIADQAP